MLRPVRPSRTQQSGKDRTGLERYLGVVKVSKSRYDAWLAEVSARRIRMKNAMLSTAICREGTCLRYEG
jgi:hypothetical protein